MSIGIQAVDGRLPPRESLLLRRLQRGYPLDARLCHRKMSCRESSAQLRPLQLKSLNRSGWQQTCGILRRCQIWQMTATCRESAWRENPGVAIDILRRFFYNSFHNLSVCGVFCLNCIYYTHIKRFSIKNENIYSFSGGSSRIQEV